MSWPVPTVAKVWPRPRWWHPFARAWCRIAHSGVEVVTRTTYPSRNVVMTEEVGTRCRTCGRWGFTRPCCPEFRAERQP